MKDNRVETKHLTRREVKVLALTAMANGVYTYTENGKKIFHADLDTPRKAYAELIDKIIGKGTWALNPWTFVYDFKLIK